jgi:inner membrane protein involved in colicin E2 resistance
MAVHYIEIPLDLQDFTGETLAPAAADVACSRADEINIGAFRGLAFALIFETVLVSLGGVLWQLLRMIH